VEACPANFGTAKSLRSNDMQPIKCDSCSYLYNSLDDYSHFVAKQICSDSTLGLEYNKVSTVNSMLLPVVGIIGGVLLLAFIAICYYCCMERKTRDDRDEIDDIIGKMRVENKQV
jgi:hypothetical protein